MHNTWTNWCQWQSRFRGEKITTNFQHWVSSLVSAWQRQGYLSLKIDFFILWVPRIKFRPLCFQGKCFVDRTSSQSLLHTLCACIHMCVHTYIYVCIYTYVYIPLHRICGNIIVSLFVFMGYLWMQTVCLCINFPVFFLWTLYFPVVLYWLLCVCFILSYFIIILFVF